MRKLFTPVLAVLLTVGTARAAIVVDYEFNEAAGSMTNAVDSAGSAIAQWTHDANWALDGSGNMVVSGNRGRQNQYLDTSSIAGGTAYYRIDFASWDSSDSSTLFGIRLRNEAGTDNRLHDVAFKAGSGSSGNLNSDSDGAYKWLAGGISNPNAGSYSNGMSVILSADLDNDTWSVWRDIGRTGTYTALFTNQTFNLSGDTVFGQVNALTFDPGGGTVAIDRIVLGTDFNEIVSITNAPPPSPPTGPNVLLVICDDLNDFEGIFGGHPQAQTPNIDTLASNGVQFVNAHSAAPICGPSRSSFMTGIYPHTSNNYAFENWYNPGKANFQTNTVLENSKTLMRYMRDNGYQSYGTGKIMHYDLTDNYVYPAGHPESGNLQQDWDEYGAKANYGPVAFDPNANAGAGEAVNHPSIPATFYEGAGSLNSLFGSLTNVPTVNGYTGWWKSGWLSAGAYNYVDDNNRDDMQDEEVRKWAVNKINALAASDPTGENEKFFMAVGFHNPHTPLVAPQKYFELYPTNTLLLPPRIAGDVDDTWFNKNLPPNTSTLKVYSSMVDSIGEAALDGTTYATEEAFLKAYLQAYLACVSFVDAQVGALVDALDASPYASNTIVILTSDHGYEWGEKEALSKNTLWETSTRVPLVIRAPGYEANANKQVAAPVGLIDLYPTVRDLCGLASDTKKNGSGADLDGHSLRPFLEDPDNGQWDGPSVALSEVSGNNSDEEGTKNFAVRSKDWRYIRYENGQEELYNHATDPYEFTNLVDSADSAAQAQRTELQNALYTFLPSLATNEANALVDHYFDWLGDSSHPNANTTPWFTTETGNIWEVRRDSSVFRKGSYALKFEQRWLTSPAIQNLDMQLEAGNTYDCSLWMQSNPGDVTGANPAIFAIELWTSPTPGGTYTKRADMLAGVQNSSEGVWEQFSGALDAAGLSAYAGEYIQFRIQRNNNVNQSASIDEVFFDGYGTGSFQEWAHDNGINKNTWGYDLDLDGLINFEEFALGGDPANAASTGHQPTFEGTVSNFHYVYPRRKNAALTYSLETRTNLVSGTWAFSGYTELPVAGTIDADFEAVTNEIPVSEDNKFIRLKIETD